MNYSTLVRDKIPVILKEKQGQEVSFYTATDEEYFVQLKQRLQEEILEFSTTNTIDELADIVEIIYALAAALKHDKSALETLRLKKYEELGGFEQKIILTQLK
jgi:predicted house-cleaning noncanonical NTP pyrophosphatase (MazG superfamily)